MGIEEIVDVQIDIKDAAITRASFDVGLIIGSSDRLTGKTQRFSDIDGVEEVFQAGDPELKMATQYFGQEIHSEELVIGQRDADVAQEDKVIIPVLQNSTVYSITTSLDGATGVLATFTSDGSATRAEIVTGLIAAINATSLASKLTLTNNGDDFNIESNTAGVPLTYVTTANLSVQAVVANVDIRTELALINADDSDWYVLMSASHTDLDIKRAATDFIQPRRKIYIASSQDGDIVNPERHVFTIDFSADFVTLNVINLTIDGIPVASTTFTTDQATTINLLATNIQALAKVLTATVTGARQITVTAEPYDDFLTVTNLLVTLGASQATGTVTTIADPTTDLGAQLKALTLDRTALMYHSAANTYYPECAWVGGLIPKDPGKATWFGKQLSGVPVDVLSAGQKSKALSNNVNTYVSIAGQGITQNGKMASGRFIDIRRDVDALTAGIEERVYFRLINEDKIPYTDEGVAVIQGEVDSELRDKVKSGMLRKDPAPKTTVPLVADIDLSDRAERLLPDVNFTAELAGAVHKVKINGVLSV